MHEARELWQSSVSRAHSSISKRKNTTEIKNLSVRARRHIFSFPLFFFFKKKKKKKKTPFNPYPNWGPNETIRDNNSHMVSILSLNVQDSFIATVSCRLQENIHLVAHFLVGVQIDPSKKKKKKKKTEKYCREALGR